MGAPKHELGKRASNKETQNITNLIIFYIQCLLIS